jgi:ABC-type glycerol-3-phosphate transport system permease component
MKTVAVYFLLILVAALVLLPLLWAVSASFTPLEKVFEHVYPFSWRALVPQDFTWEAYTNVFQGRSHTAQSVAPQPGLGRPVVSTFILAIGTVVVGGLICALAGFAFAQFDFRGKNLLFSLVLLSFMMPVEVTIIPLFVLVKQLGWVNSWQGIWVPGLVHGMVIFVFRQFFSEIPRDLIDAARVDGAGWFRTLRSIVLPLSLPVMISAGLILFLYQWDAFLWPMVISPSQEFRLVQVAISLSIEEHQTLWNELLAGSMFAAILPILLILPFQRYYVRGITGSGLKE